jgi:hypothetical protein
MDAKEIANVNMEVDEEFVKTLKKLIIRPKKQRTVAM